MAKLGVRINLSNGGLSQITSWDFNSVIVTPFGVLGAKTSGVHALVGTSDNGVDIAAWLTTPLSTHAVPNPKRIRKMYLEYKATGQIEVTAMTPTGQYTVLVQTPLHTEETATVLPGHRGKKGTDWQFKIANIDGSAFALDSFSALFVPLTRSRGIR